MGNSVAINRESLPKPENDPELEQRFQWGEHISDGIYHVKVPDDWTWDENESLKEIIILDSKQNCVASIKNRKMVRCLSRNIVEHTYKRYVEIYQDQCEIFNGHEDGQEKVDMLYDALIIDAKNFSFEPPTRIILDAKTPLEGAIKRFRLQK